MAGFSSQAGEGESGDDEGEAAGKWRRLRMSRGEAGEWRDSTASVLCDLE